MLRRSLALLVAAILLAVGSASVAEGAKRRAENPRLHAFRSCTNLLTYAQRNGTRIIRDTPLAPVSLRPPTPVPIQEDAGSGGEGGGTAPAAPQPVSGRETPADSPTNVQEQGVDEPDWVKASGSTVLVAAGERLHALDARRSPPTKLDSIPLAGAGNELLVRGNRALAITRMGFGGGDAVAAQGGIVPPQQWLGRTRFTEIDISDPRALKVVKTYDVEGDYTSARLTGATVRVVLTTPARGIEMPETNAGLTPSVVRRRWVRSVRRTRTRAWLPAGILRDRRTGKTRRRAAVRCRQVRRTKRFSGLGTITVLTIDMNRGLPAIDADALMTEGSTVYASQDRLYVASERWLGEDPTRSELLDQSATGLHAFSTKTAGSTDYVGSGEVPGYLLNQWSLSEHEGVLRVATTSMPPWESGARSESAVRTLEEREGRLTQLGAVSGLGAGERIYAVRFMGDTGYVVTFRQTDPLYVIDLANPALRRRSASSRSPATRPTCTRSERGCCSASVRTLTSRAAPGACSCRCSTSPTRPVPPGSTRRGWATTPSPRSRTTTTRSRGGRRGTSPSSRCWRSPAATRGRSRAPPRSGSTAPAGSSASPRSTRATSPSPGRSCSATGCCSYRTRGSSPRPSRRRTRAASPRSRSPSKTPTRPDAPNGRPSSTFLRRPAAALQPP